MSRIYFWLAAASATMLATLVFLFNIFNVVPPAWFSTLRDGSESLVLGKIIAEREGVNYGKGNLGFFFIGEIKNPGDVFRVYDFFGSSNAVLPFDLSDEYWLHGYARNWAGFFVRRSSSASELGYHPSHFPIGATIKGPDNVVRQIEKIEVVEKFINVHTSGPVVGAASLQRGRAPMAFVDYAGAAPKMEFHAYFSQYGLMGKFYSFISKAFEVRNLTTLHFLSALFLAASIVYVSYAFGMIVSPVFGFCFFAASILSPCLTVMARDLYWSPFLWFVPLAISLMWYRSGEQGRDLFFLGLIFFAFLAKFLSGYEYLTSVVLLACSVFMIAPLLADSGYGWRRAIAASFKIGVASLLAFALSVLMGASQRSASLAEGLALIYRDARRRLDGIPEGPLANAADYSVFGILKRYVLVWDAPVLPYLGSLAFAGMNAAALIFILCKWLTDDRTWKRDIGLWLVFLAGPLSWLLLARSHSYIHTHLNYALWYFGFVPAVLYIVIDGGWSIGRRYFNKTQLASGGGGA